jgi:hypothetical protein
VKLPGVEYPVDVLNGTRPVTDWAMDLDRSDEETVAKQFTYEFTRKEMRTLRPNSKKWLGDKHICCSLEIQFRDRPDVSA